MFPCRRPRCRRDCLIEVRLLYNLVERSSSAGRLRIIRHLVRIFETLDVAVLILTNKMSATILPVAQNIFNRRGSGILPVLFTIEIFDRPDSGGNARLIERRTHAGPTAAEALRTARANLRTPPPSAYSFSMRAGEKEVGRWKRGDGGNKADVLDDIESARKDDA
jgi:hypothetical protein